MKSEPSHLADRMEASHALLRAGMARAALASCLLAVVGACSPEAEQVSNPNRRPESILAPTLLRDVDQTQEYLADFPSSDYQIVDVPDLGRFYLDDNPAWVKRDLRAGRPWEPRVRKKMALHTVEGSTALDVGAHIGAHALTLAQLVGPQGMVYAFEPQRKIFRELVKNRGR